MSTNVLDAKGATSPNAMCLMRLFRKSHFGYSCTEERFFLFSESGRHEAHTSIARSEEYDKMCYRLYVRIGREICDYRSVASVRKQSNLLARLNGQEQNSAVISVRVGPRFHTVGCDSDLAVKQVNYAACHYPSDIVTLWHEVEYSNVVKYYSNGRPEHAQIVIRTTTEDQPTDQEKAYSAEWAEKCGFGKIPYKFHEENGFYSQTGSRFSRSAVSRRFS